MPRRIVLPVVVFACLAGLPHRAAAQALGIGPRVSFVRGDFASATPSATFMGGTLRMKSSRHMSIEMALDYRAYLSPDGLARTRDMPFQASILIFPVRGPISPYLLGGFGVYSEMADQLDSAGAVTATTTTRRTGWHLGMGAEIFVSHHTALFADYRFRFIKLGSSGSGSGSTGSSLLSGLNLSHQGSMWTSGMAFYF
jgi:Outer membrane protein beta-barrel domain